MDIIGNYVAKRGIFETIKSNRYIKDTNWTASKALSPPNNFSMDRSLLVISTLVEISLKIQQRNESLRKKACQQNPMTAKQDNLQDLSTAPIVPVTNGYFRSTV